MEYLASSGSKPDANFQHVPITSFTTLCQNAVQAGILCNLPTRVLFALGLESAINLAFNQVFFKRRLSDEVLEQVIERTWRSIQNN